MAKRQRRLLYWSVIGPFVFGIRALFHEREEKQGFPVRSAVRDGIMLKYE
jgi:hypothetical protein